MCLYIETIAEKLAKKQTKFRKMTKTEIASLRRRISFVQSGEQNFFVWLVYNGSYFLYLQELEKIQMGKEETLSVVFALTEEHCILNDRYCCNNPIAYIISTSHIFFTHQNKGTIR